MDHIGAEFARLLPNSERRAITPEERDEILATVDEVLEAAVEWQAGRLPTTEAMRVGAHARYLATVLGRKDERWPALQALTKEAAEMQGWKETRQGWFARGELGEVERQTEDLLRRGIVKRYQG